MTSSSDRVAELISRSAEPLPNIDSPEFGDWFDRFDDADQARPAVAAGKP